MEEKVVLITGAGSGIGAGTAVHLASLGCKLSLVDISREGLEKTQGLCLQAGRKEDQLLLIPADLKDVHNLGSIVDRTVEKFGRLDVLVNNAACCKVLDLQNTTAEDYDAILNTNLKAVFFLTQKAMPHLIESKGCVVSVSSGAGQRPGKDFVAYSTGKAALDHFTRIVALDVAGKGVRVNAIAPGMIKTPIYETFGQPELFEKTSAVYHAMGRGGNVEEVARGIAFLADNSQSSFITGEVLLVDGGYALMGPL